MPGPKNITETTTLAELHEQRLLLGVIALRVYPPTDSEDAVAASVPADVNKLAKFLGY